MAYWMEIARRRGESLPNRAALIRVLHQQSWLERRPEDPAYDPRLVAFFFDLGTLELVEEPSEAGAFEAPWLAIRLAMDPDDEGFEPVLRRLVGLAQELDMTLFVNAQSVSAELLASAVMDLRERWQASLDALERAEQEAEAAYTRDLEAIGPPPPRSERDAWRVYFSRSIEDLPLSVRTYNCLRNAGVQTLGDLVQKTEAELLTLRNFGQQSRREIQGLLDHLHLRLGMRF